MDYVAIYPLIAGTFTPLCLVFYHDSSIGWSFCAVVWGLALVGMWGTLFHFDRIPKWLSMTLYITLGWMGACMTYWLLPMLGWTGFLLFLVGGIFYTGGGYIYSMETPNPFPGSLAFMNCGMSPSLLERLPIGVSCIFMYCHGKTTTSNE